MKKLIPFAAALLILASGCEKTPTPDDTSINSQAWLLNEGIWGANNAEISCLSRTGDTIQIDWFSSANGRGLGDLGQDLIHYGNRLYATVYSSNIVEVINPLTGASIKQIDMQQRGPRYLAAYKGKLYVSCYDHTVVRIDTATLTIEATCPLSGMQPEGLCIQGSKLYVCNCWQYGTDGSTEYDSTLSVIDLATFTETSLIPVGLNPGQIMPLGQDRLLVACAGDYGGTPALTLALNPITGHCDTLPVAATRFAIHGADIYLYTTTYDSQWRPSALFYRVDTTTLSATPILTEYGSTLSNAYGIHVDPQNGNLYICNSPYNANADLYTFSPSGTLLRQVEGGSLASKVVF